MLARHGLGQPFAPTQPRGHWMLKPSVSHDRKVSASVEAQRTGDMTSDAPLECHRLLFRDYQRAASLRPQLRYAAPRRRSAGERTRRRAGSQRHCRPEGRAWQPGAGPIESTRSLVTLASCRRDPISSRRDAKFPNSTIVRKTPMAVVEGDAAIQRPRDGDVPRQAANATR